MTNQATPQRTRAEVAKLDELAEGSMKMVSVGEQRVVLIRTSSGVHALDNACPHQGYGLATGSLSGEMLTCQWHNWKFDVSTGRCVMGEEDVACHQVSIDDGTVSVEVVHPTDEERRERLWPSLVRGLADDYTGQVARDTVRLLDSGADPSEIMAEALSFAAPKADYGVGHEMAMAADCLALSEIETGDDRALPLVQGLSGLAEVTRDRPVRQVPTGDASIDFGAAIESEDVKGAMASVVGRLERGDEVHQLRHEFLRAVSAHHLSYGHGIIYTQKAFELLDRLGWDHAPSLLPHLAARVGYSTREDTLPYMRKAVQSINAVDLDALAAAPERSETGWSDPRLVGRMLASQEAPIDLAVEAVRQGAGVEGLLDTLTKAVSLRLLNHDLDVEFDTGNDFGWLDITHGLTTARAVRWAWHNDPGPHVARLAMWATWLLFDTGRSERRLGVAKRWLDDDGPLASMEAVPTEDPGPQIERAVLHRQPDGAVSIALGGDPGQVGVGLASAALADRAGSFIVMAHLIKTAQAAREEADMTGSPLPLAAAARFLAAPRLERFVARNVVESIDFVRTGRPPRR